MYTFFIEMSSLLIGLQFVVDDETLEVEIKIQVRFYILGYKLCKLESKLKNQYEKYQCF